MVVSVVFRDNPKRYDYLTDIPDFHRGEFAVVPVGPPTMGAFEVVRVVGLKEESAKATAWVVQRVDFSAWKKRMREQKQEERTRNREAHWKQIGEEVNY